jgi:AbrB family looped-hinge helix DNA binding protein
MRVTSKGQITMPQDVRKQLGIEPGTDVEFVQENGKITLRVIDSRTEFDRWLDSPSALGRLA